MFQRLYVHNFRCLNNFELSLRDHQSMLLLGSNGSGKSTVRAALEILQRVARGENRVKQLLGRADMYRFRVDEPLRIEVDVLLHQESYRYTLALELLPGFKELRVLEESLRCGTETLFSRELAQVHLGEAGGQGAGFRIDWHLVALPLIQERSPEDPLAIFRLWLSRMLVLAPVPSRITGESSRETLEPDREVSLLGDWFSGLIAHAPASYAQIQEFLEGMMPDFGELRNPVVAEGARSLRAVFRDQDGASLEVPLARLSDGEKAALICALVLAAHKAHAPVFCFWDEPDSHLALEELGHFIATLRRSFKAHGGQLMVTSHSEETIRRFSHENTFYLYRRSHLEPTQVRRLDELEVHGDLVDALIRGDVAP